MCTLRRSPRHRWTTLASRGRRSAQSRRVFLRPPPENLIASERDCARHDAARGTSLMSRLVFGLFCAALSLLPPFVAPVRADTIGVQSAELVPDDDDYVLTAHFDVAFNPPLKEALQNGVSLYCVLEFELGRPRWYWRAEKVAQLTVQ